MKWEGEISQDVWDIFRNGIVSINICANDSNNNYSFDSVDVIKDSAPPTISLLAPIVGETFGKIAPNFTIAIYDANLDDMWYTLNGGITNITFTTNGTLNQSEWTSHRDGIVTVIFYTKDFAGNEFNIQFNINKDSSAPIITVITPLLNEYLSHPPQYSITVIESALDSYWYTIDDGITNISLSELSGTLEDTEWYATLDGSVTIRFYANDSYSNENFAEITVIKDVTNPIITIIAPEDNQEFLDDPPGYWIQIDEISLESFWYTIDGGLNNYIISTLTDSIDSIAWQNAPEATVNIEFYSKDRAGNIGTDSVTIIKNTLGPPAPPTIQAYDLYLFIGLISVISTLIIRKRLKS